MKALPDVLDQIASSAAMQEKLALLKAGGSVVFEHVAEAAQPFLGALLARHARARVWLVCRDVRRQEAFHNELLNWFPEALFFPEADLAPVEGALPDPETAAERLGIIQKLGAKKGREIVVLTAASLDDKVPAPATLKAMAIQLKRGTRVDREGLIAQLAEAGYEHVPQVAMRGQYAVRGGILDIYSFHHTLPVRIEFYDDEIESMRHFDLDAQTSVQHVDTCTLLLGEVEKGRCELRQYLQSEDLLVGDFDEARARILEGAADDAEGPEDYATAFTEHGLGEFEAGDFVVDEMKRERFFAQLREWRQAQWRVSIFCNNEGEIERLREIIPAVEADPLHFVTGTLARGFLYPAGKVAYSATRSFSGAIAIPAPGAWRYGARAKCRVVRRSISAS